MFVSAVLIVAWTSIFTSLTEATVPVCHRPPGNPGNFRTIQVAEESVSAHVANGDLNGACNAWCRVLCDDNNACTIDDQVECEENGCNPSEDRLPVVCDIFGEVCNATLGGCINPCDDGFACTEDINRGTFNEPICGYITRDDECNVTAGEKCFKGKGCLPFCDGLDQNGGHLYYYEPAFSTWLKARDDAPSRLPKCCSDGLTSPHLVTITSLGENTFVKNLLLKNDASLDAWIGLSDLIPYGNFDWVTGEPVDFTAWGPGEPRSNVGSGERNCSQISPSGGTWSTLFCGSSRFSIFEYDCGV